jgi:hypothetical protein
MSTFMRGKYVGYYARLTNNFNFMTVLLLGKAVISFAGKKVKSCKTGS